MKRAVLVLAAGQGTRMKSPVAKVLHPFLGRPLLVHLLESLRALGADRMVVVAGHQREQVCALAKASGAETVIQEPQLGTGHALAAAAPAFRGAGEGQLLLVAGDVPLLPVDQVREFWEVFGREPCDAALVSIRLDDPTGYGRVERDGDGRLLRVVEERDATEEERAIGEVNSGVYFFRTPAVFGLLDRIGKDNAQGEYYLTDLFRLLHQAGTPARIFEGRCPGRWLGVNSQAELARSARLLQREIIEGWMAEGVTVLDPDTAWVEPGVVLEPGVILHPFVRLGGRSHVETRAEIGSFSAVQDSRIGAGTLVKEHCSLYGTVTGPGCILGPFCRTREGTQLEARVHLGNFVETKKAKLGEGVKANHLSYLGDATVGAGSNVGAGTITCNYDGVRKHPTVLGERVFVGSDTQLVAPVTVGDGAYIGAGTTVTKDVPAGALAISRAPQRVIEGWAARKRGSRSSP
jgi:bifunctional UDP-N-acetylglucosamine pyrophosphorylase/glucosamine-1-phosphate N-acetyltransferase